MNRSQDWLNQAQNDLEWARHSLRGGFFAQTCFVAQQASEKALKALCLQLGYDVIRTHSLFQIVKTLGENGDLEKNARQLDLYYLTARYPDAIPAGAPFEVITAEQAEQALEAAQSIFDDICKRIGP